LGVTPEAAESAEVDVRELEDKIIDAVSTGVYAKFEDLMMEGKENPSVRRDRILSSPARWLFKKADPAKDLYITTLQDAEDEDNYDPRAPAVIMAAWARWMAQSGVTEDTTAQEEAFYFLGEALYQAQEALADVKERRIA